MTLRACFHPQARIILGEWVYDNQTEGEPSSLVHAFGAVTGKPD